MSVFFFQNQFDKKDTFRTYKTIEGVRKHILKLRSVEKGNFGITIDYRVESGIYIFTFTPGGYTSWTPGYQSTFVDDSEYRPRYLYINGVETPAVETAIQKVQGGHPIRAKRLDPKETA